MQMSSTKGRSASPATVLGGMSDLRFFAWPWETPLKLAEVPICDVAGRVALHPRTVDANKAPALVGTTACIMMDGSAAPPGGLLQDSACHRTATRHSSRNRPQARISHGPTVPDLVSACHDVPRYDQTAPLSLTTSWTGITTDLNCHSFSASSHEPEFSVPKP